MGMLFSALGSRAGGMVAGGVGSLLYNRQFNRFQHEQVDPVNRAAQGALNQAGFGNSGNFQQQAQRLGDRGMNLANSGFNPGAINRRFNQSFGEVNRNLGELPGQTQQQQQQALSAYGRQTGGIAGDYAAGAQDIMDRSRGLTANLYGQARADTYRNAGQEQSANNQMLSERGFGGSTISSGLAGSTNMRRDDELRRITAQEQQAQLGVEGGLGQQLMSGGASLRAGFAGGSLQGGLGAAGVNASTGLNAYGQQAGIGGTGFDAQTQGYNNRLGAMNDFGRYGIDTGIGTFNTGMGYYGSPYLTPPQYMGQPQIQPHG